MTQRNEILEEIEAILPSEIKSEQDMMQIFNLITECYGYEGKDSEEVQYLETVIRQYQEALEKLIEAKEYVKKELKKCKLVQIKDKLIAVDLNGVKIRELNDDIVHIWDEEFRMYRLYGVVCKIYDDRTEYSLESIFSKKAKRTDKNKIYRIKV